MDYGVKDVGDKDICKITAPHKEEHMKETGVQHSMLKQHTLLNRE